MSLQHIVVLNLRAHSLRTGIFFLFAFLQAVCIFCAVMTAQGVRAENALAEARLGADVIAYPKSIAVSSRLSMQDLLMQGNPVKVYRDRSLLARLAEYDGFAQVTHQIYLSDRLADGREVWIFGIEPESDFVIAPWLPPHSRFRFSPGVVAAGCNAEISSAGTVRLFQRDWPVGERLEATGSLLDSAIFADMETVDRMLAAANEAGIQEFAKVDTKRDFSAVLMRVKEKEQTQAATNWVNLYLRKMKAAGGRAMMTDAAIRVDSATRVFAAMSAGASLLLLFALGVAQSSLTKERRREFFLWTVVGASRALVRRLFLSEAVLVHGAGALVGAFVAVLGFVFWGSSFLPEAVSHASHLLSAGTAAVVFSVLFGVFAAWREAGRMLGASTSHLL